MFYKENEINNNLICPSCNIRYELPKILPCCGETICNYCVAKLPKEFRCSFCSKDQSMPQEGFLTNNILLKFLTLQPNEIYRSNNVNQLKTNLNEIKNKMNVLTDAIENGADCIKEHCLNLRTDVQFTTETIMKEVSDFGQSMIDQIDKYEKERLAQYNSCNIDKNENKKFVLELKQFYDQTNEYLKRFVITDEDILTANERANKLKEKSIQEKITVEGYNFNGKYLSYKKNIESVDRNILGLLVCNGFGPVSYTDFQRFKIKDLLIYSDFKVEAFGSKNYLVSRKNSNGHYNISKIQENKALIRNTISNLTSITQINFKIGKSLILIYTCQSNGNSFLKTFNENFEEVSSLTCNSNYVFAINDSNIYILTKSPSTNNLLMYNLKFQLLKTIGQTGYPTSSPFYFPYDIIQLENRNGKFFWLNPTCFSIINETNGILIKTIQISANKFMIDSKDNIIFVNYSKKTISYFNSIGNLSFESELHNFPKTFTAFIDLDDKVCFFDQENYEILYPN